MSAEERVAMIKLMAVVDAQTAQTGQLIALVERLTTKVEQLQVRVKTLETIRKEEAWE